MLGVLRGKGFTYEMLKPEFGELPKIYLVGGERPKLLCEFGKTDGWKVQEGNLQSKFPDLSAAEVLAAVWWRLLAGQAPLFL